jgi:hypothetical protein
MLISVNEGQQRFAFLMWEPGPDTLSMDVYLESMERIMADIVTLRFGVKSHDHKSSRSNQAHWQALLVLQYAYTGPPNKRVSVHSVVMGPRPDNVPEDWVIDHIDRDRFNNTGESSLGLANFNAFNAKRPIQVFYASGVSICPEQANRFRAKGAGGVHIGNWLEREAAIASATFYVRKWQVGRNQRLAVHSRPILARRFALKELAISREHAKESSCLRL